MPNVHQIITAHNKTVPDKQSKPSENLSKECNCRQKESCPLRGKCLTESVVYQATVTRKDNQHKETYVGLTEGAFKTRYNNHTSSFRNPKHKHSTELSKYIWHLKQASIEHSIHWKILKKCKAYSNKTKRCNLCLHEKYIIHLMCAPEGNSEFCFPESLNVSRDEVEGNIETRGKTKLTISLWSTH